MLVAVLSLFGLNGCTKKTLVTQKITEFESGSTITLNDLVTVESRADSAEAQGPIETMIPGTYEVLVIAKDGDETKEFTIKYKVVDTTAPVMTQNSIPTIAKDEVLKLSDFVTVTDNSGEDLTNKLDENIPDTSASGDYDFEVTLTDASGNSTTLVIKYTVMNDAPPVIKQTFIPTLPQGYAMKLSEILSVTDDSGEDFTSKLAAIKIDSSVLGTHEVTFKIKDSAGNESSVLYKYTVVASNALAPRITVKNSYLYDSGKTWKAQITFNNLTIVDTVAGLPNIAGEKYVVMDLTIKNIGTDNFNDDILMSPEILHPEVVDRNIVFAGGDKINLNPRAVISTDSSKTYAYLWTVGQSWRLYWYVSVSDDLAKTDFVINVPINCAKYQVIN